MKDIYSLCLLKFYHKYKNNSLPVYFNGMFDVIYPSHNYATRQRDLPLVARCKTKLAESIIRYSLPSAISQINVNITNKFETHSIKGLSNYAKNFFISQYNPECVISNCYICNN